LVSTHENQNGKQIQVRPVTSFSVKSSKRSLEINLRNLEILMPRFGNLGSKNLKTWKLIVYTDKIKNSPNKEVFHPATVLLKFKNGLTGETLSPHLVRTAKVASTEPFARLGDDPESAPIQVASHGIVPLNRATSGNQQK
jgi:hypothetical protein